MLPTVLTTEIFPATTLEEDRIEEVKISPLADSFTLPPCSKPSERINSVVILLPALRLIFPDFPLFPLI
jgi:hypothetical protein